MSLPLWVSSKTVKLVDRHGNEQVFEANVPAIIHPALRLVADSAGVTLFTGKVVPAVEAPVDILTTEQVAAGIRQLMETGDKKAFTASGEPKLQALRKILNRPISDAQRDAGWELVKSEG
jgi:hypothetical protein